MASQGIVHDYPTGFSPHAVEIFEQHYVIKAD